MSRVEDNIPSLQPRRQYRVVPDDASKGSKNLFPNFGTVLGNAIDSSDINSHLSSDPLPVCKGYPRWRRSPTQSRHSESRNSVSAKTSPNSQFLSRLRRVKRKDRLGRARVCVRHLLPGSDVGFYPTVNLHLNPKHMKKKKCA